MLFAAKLCHLQLNKLYRFSLIFGKKFTVLSDLTFNRYNGSTVYTVYTRYVIYRVCGVFYTVYTVYIGYTVGDYATIMPLFKLIMPLKPKRDQIMPLTMLA